MVNLIISYYPASPSCDFSQCLISCPFLQKKKGAEKEHKEKRRFVIY